MSVQHDVFRLRRQWSMIKPWRHTKGGSILIATPASIARTTHNALRDSKPLYHSSNILLPNFKVTVLLPGLLLYLLKHT